MSALELRHLQALVALTEEGTFTDAAIRLGVSQPAVSRTIVALEAVVDTPLVERTTRSVALTPAGVPLLPGRRARPGRGRRRALGRARAPPPAALRLRVVGPRPLHQRGAAALAHRPPRHPAGDPSGRRAGGRADPRAVDIAVVRGVLDEPGIVTQRVFSEGRMAAVPVGHALAAQGTVALRELAGSTMLTTATGTTTLDLWPTDERPRTTLRVDNIDEWLTEIAGGLALGVTTESTAAQHAHPGITFLPVSDAGSVPVHLAWPATHMHPATATFVALVAGVVAG